jgi:hypothetical protein
VEGIHGKAGKERGRKGGGGEEGKGQLRLTGLYALRSFQSLQGSGWLGRSACGLTPTPTFTHSLSALRLLRKRLFGPPNRRIQPERYVPFVLDKYWKI